MVLAGAPPGGAASQSVQSIQAALTFDVPTFTVLEKGIIAASTSPGVVDAPCNIVSSCPTAVLSAEIFDVPVPSV